MRLSHRLGLGVGLILLLVACISTSPVPTATPAPPTAIPTAIPTPEPTAPPTPSVTTPLQMIAFVDQENHLCLIDPREPGEKSLTTSGVASSPAWSPDGRTLAYIHREDMPPEPGQVMLYDLESQSSSALDLDITEEWFYQTLHTVAWSPNGNYLLLSYGTSVAFGAEVVDISTGQSLHSLHVIERILWSPDGERLVFGQRQPLEKKLPTEIGDAVSLAVLEIGQAESRIVLEGTYESSYLPRAWLPDGRVLYERYDWDKEKDRPADAPTRWTVNPDEAGEPQPAQDIPLAFDVDALKALLPPAFQSDAWNLSLSADERWLLFRWGNWPEIGVYLFDRETGGVPDLLAYGTEPTWQPRAAE